MPSSSPQPRRPQISITEATSGPLFMSRAMRERMEEFYTAHYTPVTLDTASSFGEAPADISSWENGHVGVVEQLMPDTTAAPEAVNLPQAFDWSEDDRIHAAIMAIRHQLMRYYKDINMEAVARTQFHFIDASGFQFRHHGGRTFNWERELREQDQRGVLFWNSEIPLLMTGKSPMQIIFFDAVTAQDKRLAQINHGVEQFVKRFLPAVERSHTSEQVEGYLLEYELTTPKQSTTLALSRSEPITSAPDTLERLRTSLIEDMPF